AINMSNRIQQATTLKWSSRIHWFYGIVLVGLIAITFKSEEYVSGKVDAGTAVPVTGTITVNGTMKIEALRAGTETQPSASPQTNPVPAAPLKEKPTPSNK